MLLRALGVETEQCLRDYELSDSAASRAMMQVKIDKFASSLNVEPSTLAPLMAKAMGADRACVAGMIWHGTARVGQGRGQARARSGPASAVKARRVRPELGN
eukprot:COSAG04_NODE_6254_length_1372_cov_1.735271_2_plen_102_part_00